MNICKESNKKDLFDKKIPNLKIIHLDDLLQKKTNKFFKQTTTLPTYLNNMLKLLDKSHTKKTKDLGNEVLYDLENFIENIKHFERKLSKKLGYK